MIKIKQFVGVLAGALALATLSAAVPAGAQVILKAGHSQNAGEPMDVGLKLMGEHVEKATKGAYKIETFPNMQLGGEVEMIKQVMTGALDITSPSNAPLTNFVPELKIFDMPFLFRDEAHMLKVLRGPVLGEINKIVSKRGIRLLGVYNVGVRHIMTKSRVKSIDDLKGLKIRTMQSKYHMAAFGAFGANATPLNYAELYSSLQSGVVDGAEAANTNYVEKKFYEVAPYWAQIGWTILTAPIIMSEKKFQEPSQGRADGADRGRPEGGDLRTRPLCQGRRGTSSRHQKGRRDHHQGRCRAVPQASGEALRRIPDHRRREEDPEDDSGHQVAGASRCSGRVGGHLAGSPPEHCVDSDSLGRIGDGRMGSVFWRTIAGIRAVAKVVVIVCFLYMTFAVLAQVLGRYFFNYSISWSDETARFAQIWVVLIGAGIAMQRGLHVAVDPLATLLPLGPARALKIVIAAGCLWFLGVVAYASLPLLQLGWDFVETSPVLLIPMWTIYMCLPLGAAYFALEIVLSVVDRWDQPFGTRPSAETESPE